MFAGQNGAVRPLALAAVLAALAPRPASAEPVVLKLGTLAPSGSVWHELLKAMGQRWERESGGQVKLRVYAGGTQGSEGDMVRKLGIGQLQAASITNIGMHDVASEPQALSVPLLFAADDELGCALERVRGRIEAAFEARGLVIVQWSRVGAVSFFCNAPFRTPAELARAKMFAWEGDPATVEAWRHAGFQPVVLSSVDLVPALTTRMVDCVSNVPLHMLTSRAFEKANHLVDLPWGHVVGATVVRREAWERIPADLRPRLAAVAREVGARIDREVARLNVDAIEAMRRQGLTVVPVDREVFRPALERSWASLRGGAVPAAFFDEVKAARDACRGAAGARP
jgi:TRAP-type C4-dicarboxylate transport system substrate-binding protein